MSEIHDPAHPDAPHAPGDPGQVSTTTTSSHAGERPEPGNERPATGASSAAAEAPHADADTDAHEPTPGNARPAEAGAPDEAPQIEYDEAPEDSIGNRLDAPPTHMGTASGVAVTAEGQAGRNKRRRDRKRGKGGAGGQPGGPPGAAVAGSGERPQGQGAPQGQRNSHPGGGDAQHRAFHVGDKVRARVVSVGAAGVMVDLWGKEQGVLDLREFTAIEGGAEPKPGDGVDVVVIQDGVRGGNLVVTTDPTRTERAREMVVQAFNTNEPIEGLVTGVNRGGLEVDLSGVRAFCPSSQIDVRFPPSVSPKQLVLTRQQFKITSLVDDGKEAIVSRRSIVEGEVRARAEHARETIKVGQVVKGRVVSVKDYGVFVDLDGIEGMIHVSELSWNRSARPQDLVKPGDEIEAKVLKISGGQRPQTQPPPAGEAPAPVEEANATHENAGETQAEATSAEGAEAAPTGAEGEAAPVAAEGEAPAPGEKKGGPGEKKGGRRGRKEERRPQPRGVLEGLPRVVLSRRAIEPDPWAGIEKRFAIGSVHSGTVARMQPFGAFIELEPGVDGLLHVSELGEAKRIEHPNEVLKDGEKVTVRVERVDRGAKRISLSRLPEGVTEEQLKKSVVPRVGLITKGIVVEHETGGFHVQLDGVIGKLGRGFVTDRESNQPRGTDLRRAIKVGTNVNVKVIEMDRGRPKLSIRAALQDEERSAYRAYQKEANSTRVGVSLADKLRGALSKK